jgi:hypothetical protein
MEQEQLTEFKIQLALPAPNIEIAQEVANKAQVLINQFGYYQFLNLVDFMQRNPGAVSFGLNLINKRWMIMDERTLIFQKVQKGEMIFTLEKDRRSGYPIFDTARIVKVGESKPMASGAKDGFVNSVELVIQDSVSQLTIYLPSQSDEGIYNGVYYTTDIVNIINEVTMQKQNALNILNNRPKFEAIVSECDNILNSINQSPSAPSKPAPGFEEFRQYMDQRISTQETLLQRIAQELGLDKPKQQ